jgi:hypothetical protein
VHLFLQNTSILKASNMLAKVRNQLGSLSFVLSTAVPGHMLAWFATFVLSQFLLDLE